MSDLPELTREELQKITWENFGHVIFSSSNNTPQYYLTKNRKQALKVLLYKQSPPLHFRRKLWMISTGAKREFANNPHYYRNLLSYSKTIPSPSSTQIELDLKRTFPDNPKCMEESFLSKLRNVLICYSIRNSSVGYCQGMNFIVGKLLLTLENEEDVFWLFVQIIEVLLPLNYYSELSGVITETTLMTVFIEKYLPDLKEFFDKNQCQLTVDNFIHKWLVCLFTQNFNLELSDIILDFFFLEGNVVLMKTCLGVFSFLRSRLMVLNDFEDIYTVLNEKTNDIKNPQLLLYFLCVRKFDFNLETLNYCRQKFIIPIKKNLITTTEIPPPTPPPTNPNLVLKKKQCDPKWPFCISSGASRYKDILQVLILKTQKRPCIFDDYYYGKVFSYPKNDNNFAIDEMMFTVDKDVLCERHKHRCDDRKLIESSVVMLDTKSFSIVNGGFIMNENSKQNVYEIIKKGTDFEKVKNELLTTIKTIVIEEDELLAYL